MNPNYKSPTARLHIIFHLALGAKFAPQAHGLPGLAGRRSVLTLTGECFDAHSTSWRSRGSYTIVSLGLHNSGGFISTRLQSMEISLSAGHKHTFQYVSSKNQPCRATLSSKTHRFHLSSKHAQVV